MYGVHACYFRTQIEDHFFGEHEVDTDRRRILMTFRLCGLYTCCGGDVPIDGR